MTTPTRKTARKAAPRKQSPKKGAAAPVAAEQTEAPAATTPDAPAASGVLDALVKLYPEGTDLFVFKASDGTEVPFPRFTTVPQPDRAFFWRLYQMEPLFQGFEWMRYAKVPVEIQAIAVELGAEDYDKLFDEWFADAQLTAGE